MKIRKEDSHETGVAAKTRNEETEEIETEQSHVALCIKVNSLWWAKSIKISKLF